jgi:hypothetical protein
MSVPVPPELTVVADTIAAERQILEHLLFRLVEARLVLSADETRFIAQTTREVEEVVSALRTSERHRSVAVDQLAIRLGVKSEEVTLGYLVVNSPEPYATIFRHHREAISDLAVEIEQLTVENRRLATVAARNVSDTLDAIIGSAPVTTYTAVGRTNDRSTVLQTTLDEVL